MKRSIVLVVLILSGIGCQAHRHSANVPSNQFLQVSEPGYQVSFGGGNGDTCQSAVVILGAPNELEGVNSEYRWIGECFPGYKKGSQALSMSGGRSFDKISFTTADGQANTVCFDITDFFGRF